jgi:hypothetical protein
MFDDHEFVLVTGPEAGMVSLLAGARFKNSTLFEWDHSKLGLLVDVSFDHECPHYQHAEQRLH